MFFSPALIAFVTTAVMSVSALPLVEERAAAACNNYVIISTRGTSEAQGPSAGFISMIATTLSTLPGGVEYDTVYPAAADQDSSEGTADILRQISNRLASCPNTKFALLGYSQGASATTDALKQLSPTSGGGAAVKAVWLIGNPQHEAGKASNTDQDGGSSTDGAVGLEALLPGAGIPSDWDSSGKVKDVCYIGDGVCAGYGITAAHLLYGTDSGVQTMGANFLVSKLR